MKINFDPLQIQEAHCIEPLEINMVEISEDFDMDAQEETGESKKNYVYPKVGEDFVNFIYHYKARD